VVILVADDFTSTRTWGDLAGRTYDPGATCAVSLEGRLSRCAASRRSPIRRHTASWSWPSLKSWWQTPTRADFIRLVPVDIHGAATDVVAQRIEDALDAHPADVYMLEHELRADPVRVSDGFRGVGGQFSSARDAKDLNRYRGIFQRAVLFYGRHGPSR